MERRPRTMRRLGLPAFLSALETRSKFKVRPSRSRNFASLIAQALPTGVTFPSFVDSSRSTTASRSRSRSDPATSLEGPSTDALDEDEAGHREHRVPVKLERAAVPAKPLSEVQDPDEHENHRQEAHEQRGHQQPQEAPVALHGHQHPMLHDSQQENLALRPWPRGYWPGGGPGRGLLGAVSARGEGLSRGNRLWGLPGMPRAQARDGPAPSTPITRPHGELWLRWWPPLEEASNLLECESVPHQDSAQELRPTTLLELFELCFLIHRKGGGTHSLLPERDALEVVSLPVVVVSKVS